MRNWHKARDFLARALTMALAMTLVLPAGAALTGKTIQVMTGVEIFVDGVKMNPTDAQGNPVETFVYNGTTYVPLRAVSQSLGKNVNWDGANQRVYIGEAPGTKQYLLDVCPPYQIICNNFSTPSTILMAGQKYANGCIIDDRNGKAEVLFNLDGKYNTLLFDVGHVDGEPMRDSSLNIYLDGKLIFSVDLTSEMLPQHYEVPLYGALQMKLQTPDDNGCCYGIVNIEVY